MLLLCFQILGYQFAEIAEIKSKNLKKSVWVHKISLLSHTLESILLLAKSENNIFAFL
jgi:hypothetical protein